MRKHLKHFLLFAVFFTCSIATAVAQATLKGKVVDAETDEPLIGATVSVKGQTVGAVTDMDGLFTLKITTSGATVEFKYLGYKDETMKVTQKGNVDLGTVRLHPDAHVLGDVVITSQIAVARKTPVAVSSVAMDFIEEKLGTQEFPEILKSTPGVHANKDGGGYGDSEIYMRGFGNENIAVMVNGVPMNDMEWGGCLLVKLGRTDRCDTYHADAAWSGCFEGIGSFCRWYHQHHHTESGKQERWNRILCVG